MAVLALILLLSALPAFAQSCALCYTQAASSGSRMIQALRSGILVLIAPPTLGSLVVIAIIYRKRRQFQEPEHTEQFDRTW